MKKLQEIDRLVEEALNLLDFKDTNCWRDILTSFARKCAEINQEDWVSIAEGKFIDVNTEYNSRVRDGQVETPEQKQEEKPALQPLPEALPDFMLHYNRSELSSLQLWEKIRQHFGTQPRDWWHDLKKGDKFIRNGLPHPIEFDAVRLRGVDEEYYHVDSCSPYTSPTDTFRSKLSPELQEEFDKLMKEVGNG